MKNHYEIFYKAIKSSKGTATPVYRPELVDITGSIKTALILEQAMYWQFRMNKKYKNDAWWWWKTDENWAEELKMSVADIQKAKKILKELNFIETKLMKIPARTHYLIDWKEIAIAIINWTDEQEWAKEELIEWLEQCELNSTLFQTE